LYLLSLVSIKFKFCFIVRYYSAIIIL
jgi:hypothetical protein